MDSNAIDWRALLSERIAAHRQGKAGVAKELRCSRSYVSRVMSTGASAYTVVPDEFVQRVIQRYHVFTCPASGEEIAHTVCAKANGAAPTHNPMAMRVWRHCQTCANKPKAEVMP